MNKDEKIIFNKSRDFSAILDDTFGFAKQNFVKLGKALLLFAGPFIIIAAVSTALFQTAVYYPESSQFDPVNLAVLSIIMMTANIVSSTMLVTIVNVYIVQYMDRELDSFSIDQVWEAVKQDFWMMFFTTLGIGIIIIFAALLFIIPAFYFLVVLSLLPIVRIRERTGFFKGVSRCITLISGNWWITFGLILLIGIIISFAGLAFQIPQLIITFLMSFHETGDLNPNMKYINIITNVISYLSQFLYAIFSIAVAIQFFSLKEKKEASGLFKKVEQIGKPDHAK